MTISTVQPTRPALTRLGLRFHDHDIERAYQADQSRTMAARQRLALGVAAALYAAFGLLDVWYAGEALGAVAWVRFGVI